MDEEPFGTFIVRVGQTWINITVLVLVFNYIAYNKTSVIIFL